MPRVARRGEQHGLAVAVLIDATIVRLLPVPATMELSTARRRRAGIYARCRDRARSGVPGIRSVYSRDMGDGVMSRDTTPRNPDVPASAMITPAAEV